MKQETVEDDTALSGSAFETIFLAHYERVLSLLIRLVGNHMQAEELANEVFCRFYFRPETSPAWLYRTATNLGIDAIRSAARRQHYEKAASRHWQATASEPGPLTSVLQDERRRQVRTVLSSMKPPQAQILLLRAAGCSYKELAEALSVASGSVGTLLNRAEAEFRKRYIRFTGQKEAI